MTRLRLVKFANADNKIDVILTCNDFQFNEILHRNDIEVIENLVLSIGRGSYSQKRERAQELAIDAQIFDSECDNHFSYSELIQIAKFFEKVGKQFGLLKEFQENAIC